MILCQGSNFSDTYVARVHRSQASPSFSLLFLWDSHTILSIQPGCSFALKKCTVNLFLTTYWCLPGPQPLCSGVQDSILQVPTEERQFLGVGQATLVPGVMDEWGRTNGHLHAHHWIHVCVHIVVVVVIVVVIVVVVVIVIVDRRYNVDNGVEQRHGEGEEGKLRVSITLC